MDIPNPYKGDYKKLMVIPIFLVLLSLVLAVFVFPIKEGIDFKGGIEVEVLSNSTPNINALKGSLQSAGYSVDSIDSQLGPAGYDTKVELERSTKIVQADSLKDSYFSLASNVSDLETLVYVRNDSTAMPAYLAGKAQLANITNSMFAIAGQQQNATNYSSVSFLSRGFMDAYTSVANSENARLHDLFATAIPSSSASFKERTASLSATFLDQAFMVVLYSIIFTSITVFLIFRTVVPSIAVLTGAGSDVIFALGAMSIFHIQLTLASFAALLMLVGFSLDTDVLLTMRVIKRREGTAADRAYDAFKTGMTMSISLMVAFVSLLIIALITHITIYYEISAVALAGLVGDLIATWLFNAIIVLSYMQDIEAKGKVVRQRSLLSYIFRS